MKMKTYCVAQAKNIDKSALVKYREYAPMALKKHGGELVVSTTNLIALEGNTGQNDAIVLLAFPDESSALAWRHDKELAHVHDLRNKAADWTIQLLGPIKP